MGGNGARAAFVAKTLDSYHGVRFDEVGKIGDVKVVTVSTQSNTAIPVESFSSDMYYVTNPNTGRIDHITFYDKDGNIKHSIDMEYNKDGSFKPYQEYTKKGRLKSEGTHFHSKWPQDENGNKGRPSHDPKNLKSVNRYYMRFVNKALEYNKKHQKK